MYCSRTTRSCSSARCMAVRLWRGCRSLCNIRRIVSHSHARLAAPARRVCLRGDPWVVRKDMYSVAEEAKLVFRYSIPRRNARRSRFTHQAHITDHLGKFVPVIQNFSSTLQILRSILRIYAGNAISSSPQSLCNSFVSRSFTSPQSPPLDASAQSDSAARRSASRTPPSCPSTPFSRCLTR